jgi:uncharacterized membrane protein YkoI
MKRIVVFTMVGSLLAVAGAALAAERQPNLLSSQAKLSMEEAEKLALKSAPGKTTEIELEHENGNLVYSVHVHNGPASKKVEIDAISGKVHGIENAD